jgi:tRNA ligase
MASSKPFSQDDSQLITDLHSLHNKSPKLVKPIQYAAPAIPETTVESWRMNEFKYYDIPSPFPTLARGLFSVKEENAEEDGRPRYRIIARGYDKFFNIGEVPWTTVRFLPIAPTVAPVPL